MNPTQITNMAERAALSAAALASVLDHHDGEALDVQVHVELADVVVEVGVSSRPAACDAAGDDVTVELLEHDELLERSVIAS